MKFDEAIKQGLSSFWDSVAEGWQHLRHSAANALTRFKASEQTNLPAKSEIDDLFYLPSTGWAMLGGDVFEDDRQIVVRLEIPGMDKKDLTLEVQDNALVVRGEKRFEREESEGRYRVLQCAYGSFQRVVPLASEVLVEQANATYKNGVLRVALPKAQTQAPKSTTINVD